MKILFFSSNYPKTTNKAIVSGVVKNAFYLSQSLQNFGQEVTVITNGTKYDSWNINGVNVYSVGKGWLKGFLSAFILDIKMTIKFLCLGKGNFDIIHIHQGNLLILFLLKKIAIFSCPIIYSVHGTSVPEIKANLQKKNSFYNIGILINGWVQQKIDQWMWKNSDITISGSKYQIKEMQSIYKIPKDKIICIYNGADLTFYHPDERRKNQKKYELNIPQKFKIVLFVGRIARKKGIHVLIKAVPKVLEQCQDTIFLCISGEAKQFDYYKKIQKMVKQYNLTKKFLFIKNVSEIDLPNYYNLADLCVFPSLQYESIPTVVYEAMACGKPIIIQGNWGVSEILHDIPSSQDEEFSTILHKKIIKLLKDKKLHKRLSYKNLQRIKSFSLKENTRKTLDLYNDFKMRYNNKSNFK